MVEHAKIPSISSLKGQVMRNVDRIANLQVATELKNAVVCAYSLKLYYTYYTW